MEDTHAFIVDFDSVKGQGYFGVFDGHGNKHVAEWCGHYFHQVCFYPFLLQVLSNNLSRLDVLRRDA